MPEKTVMEVVNDYWEIIGIFISGLAAWFSLRSQSDKNKEDIVELKGRIGKLEDRLDHKLDDVQTTLREILMLIGEKK